MLAIMRSEADLPPRLSVAQLLETAGGHLELGSVVSHGSTILFLLHQHGSSANKTCASQKMLHFFFFAPSLILNLGGRRTKLMRMANPPAQGEGPVELSEVRELPAEGRWDLVSFPAESLPFLLRARSECPNPLLSYEPELAATVEPDKERAGGGAGQTWPRFFGLQAGATPQRVVPGGDSIAVEYRRCMPPGRPAAPLRWSACGLDGKCSDLPLDGARLVYADRDARSFLFKASLGQFEGQAGAYAAPRRFPARIHRCRRSACGARRRERSRRRRSGPGRCASATQRSAPAPYRCGSGRIYCRFVLTRPPDARGGGGGGSHLQSGRQELRGRPPAAGAGRSAAAPALAPRL